MTYSNYLNNYHQLSRQLSSIISTIIINYLNNYHQLSQQLLSIISTININYLNNYHQLSQPLSSIVKESQAAAMAVILCQFIHYFSAY